MSHRRFKIGEHPVYDRAFDRFKRESPILNPAAMRAAPLEVAWTADSAKQLRGRIRLYEDEIIPAAEAAVADVEEDFQGHNNLRQAEGRRPLDKMPERLQKRLEKAWARLDILKEEKEWVEKECEKREAKEREIFEAPLKLVPEGRGKLKGGLLYILDGQKISQLNGDGRLYIDDPRSPYDGMLTEDYFDYIVKPWCRERDRTVAERYRTAKETGRLLAEIPKRRPPLLPWPEEVPKPTVAKKEDNKHGNTHRKKTRPRPKREATSTN